MEYAASEIRALKEGTKLMARDCVTKEVHEWEYISPFSKDRDHAADRMPLFKGEGQERFTMRRTRENGRRLYQGCFNRDIIEVLKEESPSV